MKVSLFGGMSRPDVYDNDLGACLTSTVLLRRTSYNHLRRSQPQKILNVFQEMRLRFFRACGQMRGRSSFASLRRHVGQAPRSNYSGNGLPLVSGAKNKTAKPAK